MPKTARETRIVVATLKILDGQGWNELTLASVLRAAKVSWPDGLALAPSKSALVGVVLRWVAEETARRYRPDGASRSTRERVFDATMTWFDVQEARKIALRAFYVGLRRDPLTLLSARGPVIQTAERILSLAEADAGQAGPARAACFAGVLARATAVWLEDDNGMGKTMAQLDRDLRRVDRLLWPAKSAPRKSGGRPPRR